MGVQTLARAVFSAIKTAHSECVVTVVSGSQSVQGVVDTVSADAAYGEYGETGGTTGIVRVSAADLTAPEKGATIKVDGSDVFVMRVVKDPAEALLEIHYSKQREYGE